MRLLLLLCLSFCGWSHATSLHPAETRFANDFGARILDVSAKASGKTGNRLVSPVANYMAWSMVLNGAAGETAAKLAETLGVPMDAHAFNRINASNRACLDALVTRPTGKLDGRPKLTIDNGAWVSNQDHGGRPFVFEPKYVRTLEQMYKAEFSKANFRDPQAAVDINKWFDLKTEGLIPKVVSPDEIAGLMWLLGNATYFEGSWEKPFNEIPAGGYAGGYLAEQTQFNLADGKTEPRVTLTAMRNFRHAQDDAEELIEIPFQKDGPDREFVFYAVLPGRTGHVEDYRSVDSWMRVARKLASAEKRLGELFIPKFGFNYEYEAQEGSPLAHGLGLNHLFQDFADLSAMATPASAPAKVGLFKSVNRIDLDKYGVKAAAAVIVGGIELAMAPSPEFTMQLNRPFAFAIAEKRTGALVFLGELLDPK